MTDIQTLFSFDQNITPLREEPVRWILIRKKTKIQEILASLPLPLLKNTPQTLIIVVSNHKLSIIKDNQSYWQIAAGILIERLRTQAEKRKLEPIIIFSFSQAKVAKSIKLPQFLSPIALIALESTIEKTTPLPRHVFWEVWEPEQQA